MHFGSYLLNWSFYMSQRSRDTTKYGSGDNSRKTVLVMSLKCNDWEIPTEHNPKAYAKLTDITEPHKT